jgi:hypothetical protein
LKGNEMKFLISERSLRNYSDTSLYDRTRSFVLSLGKKITDLKPALDGRVFIFEGTREEALAVVRFFAPEWGKKHQMSDYGKVSVAGEPTLNHKFPLQVFKGIVGSLRDPASARNNSLSGVYLDTEFFIFSEDELKTALKGDRRNETCNHG